MHAKWLSCDRLFATAYTAAQQAPLCMGFCRQEYWSGLPFPLPGDLPNPVIKPASLNVYLHWQAAYLPVAHVHEYIHTVPKACKYYVSISYSSRCSWGPAQCTQTFGVLQFSCSVVFNSVWPHELQHPRPSCPSPTPGVYPNSCSSSRWCHAAISSSVVPFSSCSQSLPASGSFLISQLFTWGGQSIGVSASASVLPMKTQDWSLGWTGWVSLKSKGLSRVFSNTTVQKHQFFSIKLSSQSNSQIHTWPLEKP